MTKNEILTRFANLCEALAGESRAKRLQRELAKQRDAVLVAHFDFVRARAFYHAQVAQLEQLSLEEASLRPRAHPIEAAKTLLNASAGAVGEPTEQFQRDVESLARALAGWDAQQKAQGWRKRQVADVQGQGAIVGAAGTGGVVGGGCFAPLRAEPLAHAPAQEEAALKKGSSE